jgi:hypothetical protein
VQVELLPLALHAPPHPEKCEFAPAVAVRITCSPGLKLALQVCPQSIPDGLLVTLPTPLPSKATASTGSVSKLAVAATFFVNVIWQTPTPLHAPDHPPK